jgi:hypothetical protein
MHFASKIQRIYRRFTIGCCWIRSNPQWILLGVGSQVLHNLKNDFPGPWIQ